MSWCSAPKICPVSFCAMFVAGNSSSLRQTLFVIRVYCDGFIRSFVRSWMKSVLLCCLERCANMSLLASKIFNFSLHFEQDWYVWQIITSLSNILIVALGRRAYQAGDGHYDQTWYRQPSNSASDRRPNAQEIQKCCSGCHCRKPSGTRHQPAGNVHGQRDYECTGSAGKRNGIRQV